MAVAEGPLPVGAAGIECCCGAAPGRGPQGAADDGLAGGGGDGVVVKGEPTLDC